LVDKIRLNAHKIIQLEEIALDDAQAVVVAYGCTSRTAREAVQCLRLEGLKVGLLRLITLWPFPEEKVRQLAKGIKSFIVPEINYGQMVYEVERCAQGQAETILLPFMGGTIHTPEDIMAAVREVLS
jgi:2-oxoglutarate ferredoxin oxidoreductase subunit alpha